MHSSNSSPPTSRRRGQHPGSFFTIPRWMGGGGGSGSKKQLQYRSLRSLEDPTSTSSAAAATTSGTGRRKRPQPVRSDGEALLHASRRSQERDFGGDLERRCQVLDALSERFPTGPQDSGRGRRPRRWGRHVLRGQRRQETSGGRGPSDPGSSGRRDSKRGDDLGRAKSRGGFASPSPPARVTEQLAHVLGALWSCRTEGDFAARFKSCVEKHGSQYQGSEQHDAQEFLIWLLDKVAAGISKAFQESIILGEGWRCHALAGEPRGIAVCWPASASADAASQWLCHVHFVPRNSPPTKLAFHMDFGAPVEQVRLRIAAECHIPPDQLLLLEETKEGFGPLFEGDEIASALSANSRLVALELPPASTDPAVPKDSQILVFCRSRVGTSGPCLGATRAAWVSREVSVMELKKKLLEGLPTSRQSALKDQDLVNRLDVLVWDATQSLPADVDHPLFLEFVDCLLETSRDLAPAPILRVVLQWEPQVADRLFLAEDSIIDDVSTIQPEPEPSVSLSDCLAFYFTEEKLEPEEAWLCPQCDSRQQGFAQLGLWFCPEILVIHLKRFHQNGGRHSKLATRVEIPFQDLDLSNHLCQGASGSGSALYDLYAFCSHHGTGLQGGHYTACCKNPVDEQWYLFDDARVRRALDEDLAARDAYLLFYRRQPATTRRTRSSSPGHWFTRTPLPASRSHQHLARGSPSRSASNPSVRGELTLQQAFVPERQLRHRHRGAVAGLPAFPPRLLATCRKDEFHGQLGVL
ncbi:hypothetical protein MTO96_006142 [Rhipicephalus appendiculatus]